MLKINKNISLRKLKEFGAEILREDDIVFENDFEMLEFYGEDLVLLDFDENTGRPLELWLDKLFDLIKAGIVIKEKSNYENTNKI